VHSLQETTPSSLAVREVVEELKQVYATDIILGKPLEVDHLKIIPLATVGIGYGQRGVSEDRNTTRGAGGIVSPVGVLVVSPHGVQLLPIAKGVLEQVLGAVTPVVLQQIRHTAPQADTVAERQARLTIPEILATLYAFLPQNGLQFGFFPWPLSLVIVFCVGWLVLALLMAVFLSRQITAVAAMLQENYLRAGVVGLLGYGIVYLLAVVFAVSIIGIPLSVVLLLLVWAVSLFGIVSIALLVGQQCAAALRRPPYADVVLVLIGGLVLGIVRVIPVLGWIVWLILSVVGFGAVLRLQRRAGRREAQRA
jgi:uncharacterized spore protein YtfJ